MRSMVVVLLVDTCGVLPWEIIIRPSPLLQPVKYCSKGGVPEAFGMVKPPTDSWLKSSAWKNLRFGDLSPNQATPPYGWDPKLLAIHGKWRVRTRALVDPFLLLECSYAYLSYLYYQCER